MAKNMNFHIAFPVNMELHNTNLLYAFPNQNMEFNITKIQKEIIAKLITILYNTKAGYIFHRGELKYQSACEGSWLVAGSHPALATSHQWPRPATLGSHPHPTPQSPPSPSFSCSSSPPSPSHPVHLSSLIPPGRTLPCYPHC